VDNFFLIFKESKDAKINRNYNSFGRLMWNDSLLSNDNGILDWSRYVVYSNFDSLSSFVFSDTWIVVDDEIILCLQKI
jgi:hypothetical protein